MRVEWVVFDLGETLVSESRVWAAWAEHLQVPALTLFGALGGVIALGRDHTEAFDLVCPGIDLAAERTRKRAGGSSWSFEQSDLYPDALPAISELRRRGYRTAVMANQPLEAAAFLAELPVEVCATSAEWGVAKPSPQFFRRVADTLGAPAQRIAYVGDRVDNDVVPARAAGMLAVHLRRGPWGVLQAGWPQAGQAHLRLDGLAGLADALDRLACAGPS